MTTILGNDSDNLLRGNLTLARNETIKGFNGNDILEGIRGNDTLLGGKDDDNLFGGLGNDLLSGDGDSITRSANGTYTLNSNADKGSDVLIGGRGTDVLVAWGDDTLVGGGTDRYNAQLVTDLSNDPFQTTIFQDKQSDTFVAVNKDQVGYTLTIADYEIGIDRVDLRAFGVTSVTDFAEIQDKGNHFEIKANTFNGADLVLRINADPASLTYVI
jgi:RTX calcium-binding nonapeptide repeat (4 copies)